MIDNQDNCIFCQPEPSRIVAQNEHAIGLRDGYPVTSLHSLVVPRRHVADYFGLSEIERQAIHKLIVELRKAITEEDPTVTGFNLGWNCGAAAGQTIFHAHLHLIPRRDGDVEKPRGGIRHLIPGKGDY